MVCLAKNAAPLSDIAQTLHALPLFSNLSDADAERFADAARPMRVPKGKVLFIQEDVAEKFYLITNGWVKLFRETIDGTEAVVDVLTSGHMFGETAVFEHDTYGFSAQCVEDTHMLMLPTALLKQAIETNNQMALNMLFSMSAHRRQQGREIEHLNIQNAPQRIGCFLLRLCPKDPPSAITLHLPYDKTLIASRLGMKPETFSRALSRLKSETNIQIKGPMVTITNLQTLIRYTCNQCSNSFPCEE
jgi:CRP-like cAMP-binding protein